MTSVVETVVESKAIRKGQVVASMSIQNSRVRAVFGLAQRDPLPWVGRETLEIYYSYLATTLVFPFEAEYAPLSGLIRRESFRLNVLALGDPGDEEPWIDCDCGILCLARQKLGLVHLPLAEVEVAPGALNRQLVNDYQHWFWNWQA